MNKLTEFMESEINAFTMSVCRQMLVLFITSHFCMDVYSGKSFKHIRTYILGSFSNQKKKSVKKIIKGEGQGMLAELFFSMGYI